MSQSSVPDGFDLELQIPSGDAVEKQTAEIIQSEWAKIGVNVKIVPRDFGTMFGDWLEGKGGQAATFPGDALSSDTLSDDEIADLMYDPASGLNSLGTFYDNKKIIDLLADAKGTIDEDQRASDFSRGSADGTGRPPGRPAVLHEVDHRLPGHGAELPDLSDRLVEPARSVAHASSEPRLPDHAAQPLGRAPMAPGRLSLLTGYESEVL